LTDLQAIQHYTECYTYDSAGNFLTMFHRAARRNWTRNYTYCAPSLLEPQKKSNRLSETALDTRPGTPIERYSYDVRGNITRMPHLPSMEWNYEDQLSATSRQVVKAGGPETTYYVYDASGQRARKVTESGYGKRSSVEIAIERATLHIMDDKQRIALVETMTIEDGDPIHAPTPEQRYQLANHLGSASVEVDEAGGLITYEEYSPYGATTYQAGTSAAEVRRKRYRYTSKERDRENGFTYHGARYYVPWLGRWTQADPAGIAGGPNLYAYASNNRVGLVDRGGKEPTEPVKQDEAKPQSPPPPPVKDQTKSENDKPPEKKNPQSLKIF
jgi:RHS repeat-associated protein